MASDWDASAQAWIAAQGESGDFARHHILDAPMLARAIAQPVTRALDVGCGEGRFCRMLSRHGIAATGIDPTAALLAQARALHPEGDYRAGRAEALDFPAGHFDLVVSYLSLIDIPDIAAAIAEMVRVLAPGGRLLIANLNSFNTAGGWTEPPDRRFVIDDYLVERPQAVSWAGIAVTNHHRPLSTYMGLLLGQGLRLTHFDEPRATTGPKADHYNRVPYFLIMEWFKP